MQVMQVIVITRWEDRDHVQHVKLNQASGQSTRRPLGRGEGIAIRMETM